MSLRNASEPEPALDVIEVAIFFLDSGQEHAGMTIGGFFSSPFSET